jgi:monoamine oxidase
VQEHEIHRLMVQKLTRNLKKKMVDFEAQSKEVQEKMAQDDRELNKLDQAQDNHRKQQKLYGWLKVHSQFKLLKRLVKQRLVELITDVRIAL